MCCVEVVPRTLRRLCGIHLPGLAGETPAASARLSRLCRSPPPGPAALITTAGGCGVPALRAVMRRTGYRNHPSTAAAWPNCHGPGRARDPTVTPPFSPRDGRRRRRLRKSNSCEGQQVGEADDPTRSFSPLPFSCGDLTLDGHVTAEAVQIEVGAVPSSDAGSVRAEAVQNGKQASVPEYVNQDVSGTHLPATAWPRQVRPPRAEPLCGHNGGMAVWTVPSSDAGSVR